MRTLDRECSPHLWLLAWELVVVTHAAPLHVALIAEMVLSVAPVVASTSASYVPLTPRFTDAYILSRFESTKSSDLQFRARLTEETLEVEVALI